MADKIEVEELTEQIYQTDLEKLIIDLSNMATDKY